MRAYAAFVTLFVAAVMGLFLLAHLDATPAAEPPQSDDALVLSTVVTAQ